jgi:hypothetical protein
MKSQLRDIEIILSQILRIASWRADFLSLQTLSQRNSPAKTSFCGKSVSPPIWRHWLLYAAEGVPLPAVRAFRQKAFHAGADGARANHYRTSAKMRRDTAASNRLEGDVARVCTKREGAALAAPRAGAIKPRS